MQSNRFQQSDISSVWDKVAETYDSATISGADYQANLKVLLECVGNLAGKKLCEVGCGSGLLSALLGTLGARITLVDIASKALSFARRHFEGKGIAADFCLQDGLQMGFRADAFDLVWNDGVLEHFSDDGKIALIREMWRIVRPGGALLIRVPNVWDLPFTVSKFAAERRGTWQYGYEDGLSVGRLKKLARRAGLEQAEVFAYNPITGWWFLPYGEAITRRLNLNTVEWHSRRSPLGHVVTLFAKKN